MVKLLVFFLTTNKHVQEQRNYIEIKFFFKRRTLHALRIIIILLLYPASTRMSIIHVVTVHLPV